LFLVQRDGIGEVRHAGFDLPRPDPAWVIGLPPALRVDVENDPAAIPGEGRHAVRSRDPRGAASGGVLTRTKDHY